MDNNEWFAYFKSLIRTSDDVYASTKHVAEDTAKELNQFYQSMSHQSVINQTKTSSTVALEDDWMLVEKTLTEDGFFEISTGHDLDDQKINTIIAQLKAEDLQKITSTQEILEYVQRKIPGIKVESADLENLQKQITALLKSETRNRHLMITGAVLLSIGSIYFGGPLGQSAAQTLFTKGYAALFGMPSKASAAYWLGYRPLLSHFGVWGYSAGGNPAITTSLAYGAAKTCLFMKNSICSLGSYVGGYFNRPQQQPILTDEEYQSKAISIRCP